MIGVSRAARRSRRAGARRRPRRATRGARSRRAARSVARARSAVLWGALARLQLPLALLGVGECLTSCHFVLTLN